MMQDDHPSRSFFMTRRTHAIALVIGTSFAMHTAEAQLQLQIPLRAVRPYLGAGV